MAKHYDPISKKFRTLVRLIQLHRVILSPFPLCRVFSRFLPHRIGGGCSVCANIEEKLQACLFVSPLVTFSTNGEHSSLWSVGASISHSNQRLRISLVQYQPSLG